MGLHFKPIYSLGFLYHSIKLFLFIFISVFKCSFLYSIFTSQPYFLMSTHFIPCSGQNFAPPWLPVSPFFFCFFFVFFFFFVLFFFFFVFWLELLLGIGKYLNDSLVFISSLIAYFAINAIYFCLWPGTTFDF